MKVTREREACLLGSAVLAAVGAGLFADIPSAVDAMVHVEGTVVSNPQLTGRHRRGREHALTCHYYRRNAEPLWQKAHRERVP